MAKYISLYSGSTGNCSVVEEDGKFILIDMGKSARYTNNALNTLGLDLKNLQGILVSHEHSDHIAGLKVFLKKVKVPVFTNAATADYMIEHTMLPDDVQINNIDLSGVNIGNFHIVGFDTPHDSVGCMGFRIHTDKGSSMSIATDLGFVSENIFKNLCDVNLSVVESNYDVQMLKNGPYPYYLKTRVSSNSGHLSNVQSSQTTVRLIENGVKKIQLCHLSENNNTPRLALGQVAITAVSSGINIEKDVQVKTNRRSDITLPTEF